MTPLTRKRIQFWLAWSFANGLSVGTMIWLLDHLDRVYLRGGSTAIALFVNLSVVAGVQQVILRSLGWSARWWWVASCLGVVGAGMVSSLIFELIGHFLAMFAFGATLGAVQMRVCEPICKWPILWPVVSGLGLTAAVVQFLLAMPSDPFAAYLSGLGGGVTYGMFTGLGLVIHIEASSEADPDTTVS